MVLCACRMDLVSLLSTGFCTCFYIKHSEFTCNAISCINTFALKMYISEKLKELEVIVAGTLGGCSILQILLNVPVNPEINCMNVLPCFK